MHPDVLTWVIVGLFGAFWAADGIQMLRHRMTLSRLIGGWEKAHLVRHAIIGALMLFLTAHLVFFP